MYFIDLYVLKVFKKDTDSRIVLNVVHCVPVIN